MITVDARVAQKKIERVAEELHYVSTESFLRGLGLKSHAAEALSFLKRVFPSSEGGSGSTSDINEFGMHLREGFKVDTFIKGSKLGFTVSHILDRNNRAQTILNALDVGSSAHTRVYYEPIHFLANRKSKKGLNWVSLPIDKPIKYSARAGVHYTDKTKKFIEQYLLPKIKADFAYKVTQRMNRI